jgi:hypothetical protein
MVLRKRPAGGGGCHRTRANFRLPDDSALQNRLPRSSNRALVHNDEACSRSSTSLSFGLRIRAYFPYLHHSRALSIFPINTINLTAHPSAPYRLHPPRRTYCRIALTRTPSTLPHRSRSMIRLPPSVVPDGSLLALAAGHLDGVPCS